MAEDCPFCFRRRHMACGAVAAQRPPSLASASDAWDRRLSADCPDQHSDSTNAAALRERVGQLPAAPGGQPHVGAVAATAAAVPGDGTREPRRLAVAGAALFDRL